MTEARSLAQAAEAWARCSRFQSLSMVIDLANPDAGVILGHVRSTDALRVVALARRVGARFVVMAGPLLRERAEVFAVVVGSEAALPSALDIAVESLAVLGEQASFLVVTAEQPLRDRLMARMMQMSEVMGSA